MNTETMIQLNKLNQYRTSHILHLLLSLLTAGCWLPVWLLVAVSNSIERNKALYRLRHMEEHNG